MKENNVHVAYGFHVNCYHSYRGDTNDNKGFGSDIRIIRQIISVLNSLNEKGIPAKGTWDFENGYSIESILPKYAPDILTDIKERVEKFGDENIIMGYNNGALSAMTEKELEASVNWSITNKFGSGLKDVFGDCEMIVRPQEVMFSPSQVPIYNRLGVKALCLYYSCVPFDAFRSFIGELPDEFAFNPVKYTYKGDSITVLPTYNNSDVIDAGCLRSLVKDLHKKQVSGEINHDVLIFINMDADAVFWEPVLPSPFNKIANTDGIHGLVTEIADLPFVVFDTVGAYLKNHEPLKEITFSEDTADGSFSGYASWAEKPFNCQIWTRLDRARAYAKLLKDESNSPAFEERIRLLSTTHFGLASPVLNVEREKKALEMSEAMVKAEREKYKPVKEMTLKRISDSPITGVQVAFDDGYIDDIRKLKVESDGLKNYSAVAMERFENGYIKTAYINLLYGESKSLYKLKFSLSDLTESDCEVVRNISSKSLIMRFCEHGKVLSVIYKGKRIGNEDFLRSFVTYDGKKYNFKAHSVENLPLSGKAKGISINGDIDLPDMVEKGNFTYDFYSMEGIDSIFLSAHVKYPYTNEETEISTENAALGRKTDIRWEETVPLQFTTNFNKNISVVKRNFMDKLSSYEVSDFELSHKENKNLDSFNHQLTNGMIALSNGESGLCIVNVKQVLGSMAHCPMRLTSDDDGFQKVSMNPFGTYYGNQRYYPSRSNGATGDSFVIVSPQSKSIAPSYNGVEEFLEMALVGFDGDEPNGEKLDVITGIAEGSAVVDAKDGNVHHFDGDNVNFKAIRYNATDNNKLKSVITSGAVKQPMFLVKTGIKAFSNIIIRQIKARN